MSSQNEEKVITSDNDFTDWLNVPIKSRYSVSIWGTFVGTITLQKTYDGGNTILDVEDFTSKDSDVSVEMPENIQVRIGIKTGNYTSGTANVRLGGQ